MGDRARARLLVLLAALGAYANSLGNGFAFDDEWFIRLNPVVTEARYREALTEASWPGALEGTGNYRPLVLSSFALEWSVSGGSPLPFHAVSVLAHALASLLVLALLARFVPLPAALAGGLFFAVHPVHTEAVANVMGRSELYAALAYLGACLVYLDVRPTGARRRGARLLALMGLFALALGGKEIAVTLPAALVLLEAYRVSPQRLRERWLDQSATYAALALVLVCYVLVRWNVVGVLAGESAATGLRSLSPGERVLTALTVWPEYLRLMAFPLDLASDYGPAVLTMTTALTPEVLFGGLYLGGAVAVAWLLRREAPALALGFAWFVVAISPVSNLVVRSDVLLAERTLYLPSVGAAFVAAGLAAHVLAVSSARGRSALAALALACGSLLMVRTVDRNPSWFDTFAALTTLAEEHPESWLAHRTRAIGLTSVGDQEGASLAYDTAMELAPDHYQLLVEAGVFHYDAGRPARAEELLRRAIALTPGHAEAHRRLAGQLLLRGEGRAAHAVALEGLERARDDGGLWAMVSESYVAKGDLEAAVRARHAAVARDSLSVAGWQRLAQLYEAMERGAEAAAARARAGALAAASAGGA